MAPWSLNWQLARRFRGRRERSRFLGFISASSTVGIALGCMVFIAGLSVMNGFEEVLEKRFLSLVPQVEFTAVKGGLSDVDRILKLGQEHPNVTAARPVIRTQAMVQKGTEFTGVQVQGIDPELPQAIEQYMPKDTWQQFNEQSRGVVLGSQLAAKLQLEVGDHVMFLVAHTGDFREPQRVRLPVIGFFTFGGQVDHHFAYVNLPVARELVGLETGVSAVEMDVNDLFKAQTVATEIGYQIDDYVYLDHWMRAQGHLYRDIQLVRLVMYLVLILVLAVACFNIVSTLIMTVQEKQKHIGILRTMGMRARSIMKVFVWQGVQNGLWGILFGVIAGVALTLFLPDIFALAQQLTGKSLLASDVYFVTDIPVKLHGIDVVMVALVALIMSTVATIYPAWRASKTSVVQAVSG